MEYSFLQILHIKKLIKQQNHFEYSFFPFCFLSVHLYKQQLSLRNKEIH